MLIILDCCFAGQAARARLPHKVEILAAAAMGLKTPGVGQKYPSFTQVLMTEMTRILEQQRSVSVVALHREMLKKEHQLHQQPLYVALSGDPQSSIVLREFSRPSSESRIGRASSNNPSSLVLRVSLFEPPSGTQKDQILRWMTTSTPSVISAVTVEKIFLVAQGATLLGEKMLDERAQGLERETGFNIPHAAKPALLASFHQLKSMVNETVVPQMLREDYVFRAVKDIQEACEGFLDAFRDCMSTFDPSTLQNLAIAPETEVEGLAQRVSMRLRLLEASPPTSPSDYGKVEFITRPKDEERFRLGTQGGPTVLVEYYYYDSSSTVMDKSPISALIQVQKVAALHAELKDDAFCTLLGRGYIHEQLYGPRFGLIYELPEKHASTPYFQLSECYKAFPAVPLETRMHLAHRLSMAVCSMHSIGWLHKAIKSQNILLFGESMPDATTVNASQSTSMQPNFSSPYIFGFDCSRPEAAESLMQMEWDHQSNLYRHPDRWGRPLRFKKAHDIYALVRIIHLKYRLNMLLKCLRCTGNSIIRDCVLAPCIRSRSREKAFLQDLRPGKITFDPLGFVQRQACSFDGQTVCKGYRDMPVARTWRWSGRLALPTIHQRASRREGQVIRDVGLYGRVYTKIEFHSESKNVNFLHALPF